METVTKEVYAEAVVGLLELARQPTSGGRVAAQVLLSAYNGFDYQLDVSDMGSLDPKNFETAMTVIRGRYQTGVEPHNLVSNGSRIFEKLWELWLRLHVKESGKVESPGCDGKGELWLNPDDENDDRTETCPRCAGKGRLCECKVLR